jgi:LCP family protein required for cell wall assembly
VVKRIRRRRKPWQGIKPKQILIGVLILSLLWGWWMWAKIFQAVPNNALSTVRGESREGITNILIAGVDNYYSMEGRADSVMILSIDTRDNSATITSVPRDSRVTVDGYGYRKLSMTMEIGGMPLLRSKLEALLGIRIDHYIFTNLAGFEDIVDALGGITVNVPKEMTVRKTFPNDWVTLQPGIQRMDGTTTLAYLRFRSDSGHDPGRMARHREFFTTLAKQTLRARNLFRFPLILHAMSNAVRTDLTISEGLALANRMRTMDLGQIPMVALEGPFELIDGLAYYVIDMDHLKKTVSAYILRDTPMD